MKLGRTFFVVFGLAALPAMKRMRAQKQAREWDHEIGKPAEEVHPLFIGADPIPTEQDEAA